MPARCTPLRSMSFAWKSASIFQKSSGLNSFMAFSLSYTKPHVGVWQGPMERISLVRALSLTARVRYRVKAAPILRSRIWRASADIAMAVSGSNGASKALVISDADNEENLALFTGARETLAASSFASKPIFSPSLSKSQQVLSLQFPWQRVNGICKRFFCNCLDRLRIDQYGRVH